MLCKKGEKIREICFHRINLKQLVLYIYITVSQDIEISPGKSISRDFPLIKNFVKSIFISKNVKI